MTTDSGDYRERFFALAVECGALRFGQFTLKSGRQSPYFFNAGEFRTGAALAALGRCYADALVGSGQRFDRLFGPAYKGIPLVSAVAIALAEYHDVDLPWAFDRKEAKDHGEGGQLVGAALTGDVLIVDDVISSGMSVRAAERLIRAAGARPAGLLIAFDRQERGEGDHGAAEELAARGLSVLRVACLDDLVRWLGAQPDRRAEREAVDAYRARYGVNMA